jgi:myo-inositol-1(or 4)-monophosphatase
MIHPEELTKEVALIARETGHYLHEQKHSLRPEDIIEKAEFDYVSHIDKAAEIRLIKQLSALLPQAGFISEEGQATYRNETFCWIIDPLDGTTNYLHDFAPYCVSIALRKEHEIQLGVVYEVCRKECFCAWKGGGAWLNNQPIHTSSTTETNRAFIGIGLPYNYQKYRPLADRIIPHLYGSAAGLRLTGSAAANLCYVAAGRYDLWFEAYIRLWDFAAGALLVEEAGGTVSDFRNSPHYASSHHIIASANQSMHQNALNLISGYTDAIL